jgi:hypothetical protein
MPKPYIIESKTVRHSHRGMQKDGETILWAKFDSPIANFRYAVKQITRLIAHTHASYTIYRRLEGSEHKQVLFRAKWISNGMPHIEYTELGKEWLV